MNYVAYHILSVVEGAEGMDHPEMIPPPERVRTDPEFSAALDWLLEKGYVEICKARMTSHDHGELNFLFEDFDPDSDSLTVTPSGLLALQEKEQTVPNLHSY